MININICRVFFLFCVLTIVSIPIVAQGNATNSSNTQANTSAPTSSSTSPSSDVKPMSNEDKQNLNDRLKGNEATYEWKGNWYLAGYYIFAILAAIASAAVGLILQWDTPDKSYKKLASKFGFVGAVLVTVMTFIDFSGLARVNKAAANQTAHLRIQMQRGELTNTADVEEKIVEIREQKQSVGPSKLSAATPKPVTATTANTNSPSATITNTNK